MPREFSVRLLKCLLIGVLIEAPLVIWFWSIRDGPHTLKYEVLAAYHAPSVLTMLAILELQGRLLGSDIPWPHSATFRWAGIFLIQSCAVGLVALGISTLWRVRRTTRNVVGARKAEALHPVEHESPRGHRILMLKCVLIGAVIETPLFIWFSRQTFMYSVVFLVLALYHLPSLVLWLLIVEPLKLVFSGGVVEVIGGVIVFAAQSCAVGAAIFHILRRRSTG